MDDEDKLSFLDQPRDDNGRFASKADTQPAPEPMATETPPASPEPPAAPEAQPVEVPEASSGQPSGGNQPPPGYIPMAALLDERDKRQKYERELEQYRKQLEEARKAPPPAPIDPIMDPEGFEASINQRLEKARWDAITSVSHQMANRHHGAEKVKAAEEWLAGELQTNPHLWQTIQRQVDPYDFVVQQHQRTLKLSKIGDEDPEAWAAKWAEQNGYVRAGQPQSAGGAAPIQQPAPLPRPSLASAPSASGAVPKTQIGPGVAFDEAFKR